MLKININFLSKFKPYHLVIIFALLSGPAHAQQFYCAEVSLIEITAPNDSMVEDVCIASGKAISFLSKYSFLPKRAIKFQIITTSINSHGYSAYGSYDRQNDAILLMSLPSIKKSSQFPEMYGQPFDIEHYHGAIAHEIAHAIFHHNTSNTKEQLTNAAQEYIAHSTQLSVLSDKRRQGIIKAMDVGPWESGDSISVTYMSLNPTAFAVKSYLHLTQLQDPQAFVKILLNNNWFFISVP